MDRTEASRAVAWAHEMRIVHDRLREAILLARASADRGEPPERPDRDPLLYCWGFCSALAGHHQGEDQVLFPAVLREHPELSDLIRGLERDHRMIDTLLGAYRRALDTGADPTSLRQHLEGIEAIMESHFRFEERSLLPTLERLSLAAAPAQAYGRLAD